MKNSLKIALTFVLLLCTLMFGTQVGLAADHTIQDDSFSLYGGAARIADGTASDGYSAKMGNNTAEWNIMMQGTDWSALKCGISYEVYFRVKVDHAVANPMGNAFKIAVYDDTDQSYALAEKLIPASGTQDMVWQEYKIGTFKPNSGVNLLKFEVGGTNNSSQISDIYVDYLVFKEYSNPTVEDYDFYLFNGASTVADGLAGNNSAARMVNGSGGQWNIQAKIDDKVEAGKSYMVRFVVSPERADYYNSDGDVLGYLVYDYTTSTYLAGPTIMNTSSGEFSNKIPYYYHCEFGPISPNPTHDVRVCFYQVNNAADFPAFRVDKVYLIKEPVDENPTKSISAYPYKISPANGDGCNDTTAITYTLPSTKTVSAKVHKNSDDSVVRTIISGVSQSGTNIVTWDGKKDDGTTAPNGLYTVKVTEGITVLSRVNVQAITGVTLTAAANTAKDYFPKGVWFNGGQIPNNTSDAETYLQTCFNDIEDLGANIIHIGNFHGKSSGVYTEVFDKAAENGLKIIGLPNWVAIYNEGLYNDEVAMYNQLDSMVSPYKTHNGLYGYGLSEEPPYDVRLADNLKDIKRMLETLDPNHPSFVVYNGPDRIEQHYNSEKTQVMYLDPYGATDGRPVGDFLRICKLDGFSYETYMDFSSLQPRKDITDPAPMWTILQTINSTGWLRDPTAAEIRAMTYEAIGHGSKGISYFIYHTMLEWEGLVDINYNHRQDYTTVQTLFGEIETMKTTIQNMKRIGNAATTTGGGGGSGAYASADVTTHEDCTTGDKYLVVVNHDCENSQNVTITINRAKLGMSISEIRNVYDNTNISFTTDANNYIISNLNFAAGDGKILKLVRDTSKVVYTGQDSAFTVLSGATKNNTDVSASDAKTAKRLIDNDDGWYFQWHWDKGQLDQGATYDLYAVVKIKYAQDLYYAGSDPFLFTPGGNAFSYGVYDATARTYVIPNTTVVAASMENMFWHTVKIGSFVPSQINNQYVYIMPLANPGNVYEIYVDKFCFVKQ